MPGKSTVIEHLQISGYKSIQNASIDFTRLNVLIGANGAGKSNLVSFFSFLQASLDRRLDEFIPRAGGRESLLHFGVKTTKEITTILTARTAEGCGRLIQKLKTREPGGLFYSKDRLPKSDVTDDSVEVDMDGVCSIVGPREQTPDLQESVFFFVKERIAAHHVVDTGPESPIRQDCNVEDSRRLRSDASNVVAILHRYRKQKPYPPVVYRRICSTIKKIIPEFDDFVLEPIAERIALCWKQRGVDYLLNPTQLSDGSLRAIALATLLLQPDTEWPDLLIIDEPELGLHPYALSLVAGLIRAASVHTQVIVTTQSKSLLDHFSPEEIIVCEASEGKSAFRRLNPAELTAWLEDYSVGDLWEKNVIGGGPLS